MVSRARQGRSPGAWREAGRVSQVGSGSKAVEAKDRAQFAKAYDALTEGCNSCHRATNFSFNVVQRPATNPYPNQSFALPKNP